MKPLNYRYWWDEIKERLGLVSTAAGWPEENLHDIIAVEDAKREWQIALRYFQEVTEPALIDFAIYNMEAAEKRLIHLIRQCGDKYPDGIWPADLMVVMEGNGEEEMGETSSMEG